MSIQTLWYTRCPVPSAQTVAINTGWLEDEFQPEGISVRSLANSNDPAVHLSHYTHSQPNSFRFGGVMPPLIALSRGADLRIIGLGWVDRSAGLYTLQDGHRELKGARLGIPRRLNDTTDWWRAAVLEGCRHLLATQGLTLQDVTLVDIPIQRRYADDAISSTDSNRSLWGARSQLALQREEAVALVRGAIDVLYTDGATGALLQSFLGLHPLAQTTSSLQSPADSFGAPVVLTVSGQLLADHPEVVDRWVARLLNAQAWVSAHRDAFYTFASRDSGVPEELFEASYTPSVATQMDVSLEQPRQQRLFRQYEHLLKHDFIQPFNLADAIDTGPLQRATHNANALAAHR